MKDLYPNQKEITDYETCVNAINNANSVRAINKLRLSVVKLRDGGLLKLWQERYWSLKSCSGCGRAF